METNDRCLLKQTPLLANAADKVFIRLLNAFLFFINSIYVAKRVIG